MSDTSISIEEITKLLYSHDTILQVLGADSELIKETVLSNSTKLDTLNNKVENILSLLESFIQDFNSFKNESRDVEEKLILMTSRLAEMEEELIKDISDKEYKSFEDICRRNYDYWEEYDVLTRKFLPVSEILFSNLQKTSYKENDTIDYSPVVIELCRAIENEFLLKIFRRYVKDFISRYSSIDDFNEFYAEDKLAKVRIHIGDYQKSIRELTRSIAGEIRTNIMYADYIPRFTLGDMKFILDKLLIPEVIENSKLLRDFKNFISQYFIEEQLLNMDYLSKISKLITDYRNPAAHPEFVSFDKAKECKEFLPEQMDYLIECIK